MDRSLLMIVGIVFLVGLVGLLTVVDLPKSSGTLLSGNVVAGNRVGEDCTACAGEPVCAGKEEVARNYPSACAARCDYARVLYSGTCEASAQPARRR
jgi:hypothetical protein